MKCNDEKQVENELEWEMIEDAQSIDHGREDFGTDVYCRKDIELDPDDENLSDIFVSIFPCTKGHVKLIDECPSSRRSPHCVTVKKEKIELHDPQHEDSDHLVKKCYLKMIAAVLEAQHGIEKL